MFKKWFFILTGLIVLVMSFVAFANQPDTTSFDSNDGKTRVYFFNSSTCPHCLAEKQVLRELSNKGEVDVKSYEVSSAANQAAWEKVAKFLGEEPSGVPFTVIGDEYRVGFSAGGEVETWIRDRVKELNKPEVSYNDEVGKLLGFEPIKKGENAVSENKNSVNDKKDDANITTTEQIKISQKTPIVIFGKEFGTFDATQIGLPVAVFFIALIDGFNPCAMWVLIFLISMLIDVKDRKKLFLLGGIFLFVSGFIYYLALAGWSSLFNFLSPFANYINLAIAIIALVFAYTALNDYLTKKEDVCEVIDADMRKNVFTKIKNVLAEKSLFLAIIGVTTLAFSINIVELFCSLGLPMIYSSLLVDAGLGDSAWKYLYHFYYVIWYMLDDIIVFTVAVTTLNITGFANKYSRPMKLVTGIVMILIAIYLYSQFLDVWFK